MARTSGSFPPIADAKAGARLLAMQDDLAAQLSSANIAERTRATYELDSADFRDPAILAATRSNLDSADAELVAITVTRLLVRGKDVSSRTKVADILKRSDDDYVISSAFLALANLGRSFPAFAEDTVRELEAVEQDRIPEEGRASLASALAELKSSLPA